MESLQCKRDLFETLDGEKKRKFLKYRIIGNHIDTKAHRLRRDYSTWRDRTETTRYSM